jgi:peptidoglycan-associated lipoprotein
VPALKDIYFDFDKSEIRPDAARILAANIDWMKSNPAALILIEGHCDERGTNEYNLALGDRRAKATLRYLMAHGVAEARITTISYGEERPVCVGHTETCWAKNQRAHFLTKVR